jgi:hypothetical protein
MLEEINGLGGVEAIPTMVARAKDKADPFRLMGFGHRVYKVGSAGRDNDVGVVFLLQPVLLAAPPNVAHMLRRSDTARLPACLPACRATTPAPS